MTARNRLWRVTYRSGYNQKLVRLAVKVPYSGMYAMTEQLTRALATGEITWFRIEPLRPKDITPGVRARLVRWPEAFRLSSTKTEVTWQR